MHSLSSGHLDDIHQDTGRPAAHLLGIGRRGHSPGHSHQPRKMAVSYSSIGGSGRPVPEPQLAPQHLNLARCVSPHPWGLAPLPASAPAHLGRPVCWFIPIDQARYRPLGFPGGSDGKEPACNAGNPGLVPASRTIPWRRAQLLTPAFLPGESHGQRKLAGGYRPWGPEESATTERQTLPLLFDHDPQLLPLPTLSSVLGPDHSPPTTTLWVWPFPRSRRPQEPTAPAVRF